MTKKSIFEIYEPSELKRGHFTDLDNEIRKTDIPERMQLRDVPIVAVPEGSSELEDEAEWIYKQAFCKPTVSQQETNEGGPRDRGRKPPSAIGKIKQALDFMRNQQLEVPFIAFYRKELIFQVSILVLKLTKSEKDKLCFEVDEVLVRFKGL